MPSTGYPKWHYLLITKKVNKGAKLSENERSRRRERGRTVRSLCCHNPSHFSYNMDWTTHSQSLLTTGKCCRHTINCSWTTRSLQHAGHSCKLCRLDTEPEPKSTCVTPHTHVYSGHDTTCVRVPTLMLSWRWTWRWPADLCCGFSSDLVRMWDVSVSAPFFHTGSSLKCRYLNTLS